MKPSAATSFVLQRHPGSALFLWKAPKMPCFCGFYRVGSNEPIDELSEFKRRGKIKLYQRRSYYAENERAIRKNCAFFFGLVTRGFEPLGLGASRRIPSSPPVGKPDSIKSSIVKSGFFYSCFFFKFTLHTRCNSQELCVLFLAWR